MEEPALPSPTQTAPPQFSVVMPTFNAEATVAASLRSILDQTCRDLEIVVEDGGSADRTAAIVAEIAREDPRVRLFVEKDDGVFDAMNRGMARARGRWLYFLGSDDSLATPDTLEKVAALSGDHKVLYGDVRLVGDAPFARDGTVYDGPFSVQKLFAKNICHQAIFYRRDFVEEEIGTYTTRFRTCADWDFNLRCRARTEFGYLGFVVADFQAGGLSTIHLDDVAFGRGLVARSLSYFGLSPFDPAAQNGFYVRRELKYLQFRENVARFVWVQGRRKLSRWFGRGPRHEEI